jgi:Nif-specific regulatory protein
LSELIRQLVRTGISTLKHGELKVGLVDAVERELIEQVMDLCHGVGVKAAEKIGINRNTLHKKLEEYRQQSLSKPREDRNDPTTSD